MERLDAITLPPRPEAPDVRGRPSCLPLIDSHCHLDFLFRNKGIRDQSLTTFLGRQRQFLKRPYPLPADWVGAVSVWCDPRLFGTAKDILLREGRAWATFGCHPHHVALYNANIHAEIKDKICHLPPAVAWGEIGLDYFQKPDRPPPDIPCQKRVFRLQLQAAGAMGLPVVIHCRDAEEDLFKILRSTLHHQHPIHYHCVTVPPAKIQPVMDHFPRAKFGFTNLVGQQGSRGRAACESVKAIPLHRLLAETDAPYHCPSAWAKNDKSPSHPGMAMEVVKKFATLKDLPLPSVAQQVYRNTCSLYGL